MTAFLVACLAAIPTQCVSIPLGPAVRLEQCLQAFLPAAVIWQKKNPTYRVRTILCGEPDETEI